MKFKEAEEFVLTLLEKNLPGNLFYHGFHHTIDVCKCIQDLAESENVNGEPLVLLKTAALLHDCGFIEQYSNNEPIAVRMAYQYLPQFGYTNEQIKIIEGIILSTQLPQMPSTHLEEIMCDADLDYLGREDFFAISETLKQEWLAYGVISSEEEYNERQIHFFEKHRYYTSTARATREEKKQEHLGLLKTRASV